MRTRSKQKPVYIGAVLLVAGAIALIVVSGRNQPQRHPDARAAGIHQPQQRPSANTGIQHSADPDRDGGQNDSVNSQPPEIEGRTSQTELNAALEWAREETVKEVHLAYSLMFRHLGLTESEKEALARFLVEVWMSGTRMRNYNPEPIEEADRRAGIAAIIGDARLAQLLILERNKFEYAEAERVGRALQANDLRMTDAQQDQMLEILIEVRGREQAVADPNAQAETIEAVKSQLATMDEYERLVLELASSVLSARQMELLFDRYQALSYQRAEFFEVQKRARAEDEDFPLGYLPRN